MSAPQGDPPPETGGPVDSLGGRLRRDLLPIASGILIDTVDLATFGPLGLYGGFVVGGLVGWLVCSANGISGNRRWLLIAAAAAYTAMPFTEAVPLATVLAVLSRLLSKR